MSIPACIKQRARRLCGSTQPFDVWGQMWQNSEEFQRPLLLFSARLRGTSRERRAGTLSGDIGDNNRLARVQLYRGSCSAMCDNRISECFPEAGSENGTAEYRCVTCTRPITVSSLYHKTRDSRAFKKCFRSQEFFFLRDPSFSLAAAVVVQASPNIACQIPSSRLQQARFVLMISSIITRY